MLNRSTLKAFATAIGIAGCDMCRLCVRISGQLSTIDRIEAVGLSQLRNTAFGLRSISSTT